MVYFAIKISRGINAKNYLFQCHLWEFHCKLSALYFTIRLDE